MDNKQNLAQMKGPKMLKPRSMHSCCTLGDMLYVFAGLDKRGYTNSIEVINASELVKLTQTLGNAFD